MYFYPSNTITRLYLRFKVNMRPFLLLSFIIVSCILFSCKKGKLKANSASYIVVNNTTVSSSTLSIIDSHKITDIWLYINDQFQGVYPIGSVMPVMNPGSAQVRMYGGISNNGISATRLPYKFYNPYIFSGTFESNKTYTIVPDFYYTDGIHIINDSFTPGNGSYYLASGNVTTITDPARTWGGTGGSAFMAMTDAVPTAQLKSSTPLALPQGGVDVYLEMDYKCNQEISVGVICGGGVEERTALNLRATSGVWNKVYISLTSVISTQPTYNYYEVFIRGVKQSDVASPEIYLDNIRLVRP